MAKPVIGVTPLIDSERESYWILSGYFDAVMEEGGIPVLLPPVACEDDVRSLSSRCDAFLFTGGPDVQPSLYGQAPHPECRIFSPLRDNLESLILDAALQDDKPVLAVCRGMQLVNVLLGGDLYQDIPSQYDTVISHRQAADYDTPVHRVSPLGGTPLAELAGTDSFGVNSRHHQAVRRLAPSLRAMAVSEDGLVEAFYRPSSLFLWGVQWHPEHMYLRDEISRLIFRRFVTAAQQVLGGNSRQLISDDEKISL